MNFDKVIPSIRVLVFTYNQQDFILQTLQSINMQVCKYPVRITIHDDCSTDKTRALIQSEMLNSPFEWELIVPSSNQFSQGIKILNNLIFSSTEDFIAIVDGDDYWTDPYKLQKQADKLISDEKANLCHHMFSVCKDDEVLYEWPPLQWQSDQPGVELSRENFIGTLSVMLRRSAFEENIPKNYKQLKIGDYHIWALLTQNSRILFLKDNMASYRIHENNYFANQSSLEKIGFIIHSKIFSALHVSAIEFYSWFESIATDLITLDTQKNSGLMFLDTKFEQELDVEIRKLFARKQKVRLLHLVQECGRALVRLKSEIKI